MIVIDIRDPKKKERGLYGETKIQKDSGRSIATVFINKRVSKNEQFYTLVHELIHAAVGLMGAKLTSRTESIVAWSTEKIVAALIDGIRDSNKYPC